MQTSGDIDGSDGSPEAYAAFPNHSHNRRNKRFQACIACRATKTKCLPSDQRDVCQSCLKASRTCVMPGPAKPRMKSAQKFSELEKKIELLTNALAGKDQGSSATVGTTIVHRRASNLQTPTASTNSSPNDHDGDHMVDDVEFSSALSSEVVHPLSHAHPDVIDDGTIGRDVAFNLFMHWNNNMRCYMPLLFFGLDIEAEQVRKTKPILFLAIITVASSSICPSISTQLVTRLTRELGYQVFVQNTQTVDIILATLLFSQYYFRPGATTSLAPSQFVYAAVAMSSDLGLTAKARTLLHNDTIPAREAARICIGEWYAASTMGTFLNRCPLMRHSAELDKYSKILQKEQTGSDGWLYSLLNMQKIIEEAMILFDFSENKSDTAFDEKGTQYKISVLRQKVEAWQQGVPETTDNRLKQHAIHTANLHINRLAVRCFVRKHSLKMQAGHKSGLDHEDGLLGLTPAHFDALTGCINSVKAVFDIYLSLETSLARYLPNCYLFWNITAAVLMIKLGHFGDVLTTIEQSSDGHSGPQSFKTTVVNYLDSIAAKMEHLSRDGHLPQAKPYITVIRKLKPYYLQKREICINSRGDAVTVEPEPSFASPLIHNENRSRSHPRPEYGGVSSREMRLHPDHSLSPHSYDSSPQPPPQASHGDMSSGGWATSSNIADGTFRHQPYANTFEDQLGGASVGMNAAYDPYTYANTNWSALTLDEDTIQQLDSYMWTEEDTPWLQSLL